MKKKNSRLYQTKVDDRFRCDIIKHLHRLASLPHGATSVLLTATDLAMNVDRHLKYDINGSDSRRNHSNSRLHNYKGSQSQNLIYHMSNNTVLIHNSNNNNNKKKSDGINLSNLG